MIWKVSLPFISQPKDNPSRQILRVLSIFQSNFIPVALSLRGIFFFPSISIRFVNSFIPHFLFQMTFLTGIPHSLLPHPPTIPKGWTWNKSIPFSGNSLWKGTLEKVGWRCNRCFFQSALDTRQHGIVTRLSLGLYHCWEGLLQNALEGLSHRECGTPPDIISGSIQKNRSLILLKNKSVDINSCQIRKIERNKAWRVENWNDLQVPGAGIQAKF